MSEKPIIGEIHLRPYDNFDRSFARRDAVQAALEIIRAAALGGEVNLSNMEEHFRNLSTYADAVQLALKPHDRTGES